MLIREFEKKHHFKSILQTEQRTEEIPDTAGEECQQ